MVGSGILSSVVANRVLEAIDIAVALPKLLEPAFVTLMFGAWIFESDVICPTTVRLPLPSVVIFPESKLETESTRIEFKAIFCDACVRVPKIKSRIALSHDIVLTHVLK